MFISELSFKQNFVTVICDGKSYELDADAVYQFRLRKGTDIPEKVFSELLSKSDENRCLKYLFTQISGYLKTEKGYREKLKQKGFSDTSITTAIGKAKKRGYINDSVFAEKYYEKYKNTKGLYRIKEELRQKGISSSDLLFLQDIKTSEDVIVSIAKKEMRGKEKNDKERLKLMKKLSAKGFSYDEVINAVNKVFSDGEKI